MINGLVNEDRLVRGVVKEGKIIVELGGDEVKGVEMDGKVPGFIAK